MVLHRRALLHGTPTGSWWPAPLLPLWRSLDELFKRTGAPQPIAVEEFVDANALVVRAEIPGVDPSRDVEVTAGHGTLHLRAERAEHVDEAHRPLYAGELRYGSFGRTVAIPEGVDPAAISASYDDGILEIRVPLPPAPTRETPRRIPVATR